MASRATRRRPAPGATLARPLRACQRRAARGCAGGPASRGGPNRCTKATGFVARRRALALDVQGREWYRLGRASAGAAAAAPPVAGGPWAGAFLWVWVRGNGHAPGAAQSRARTRPPPWSLLACQETWRRAGGVDSGGRRAVGGGRGRWMVRHSESFWHVGGGLVGGGCGPGGARGGGGMVAGAKSLPESATDGRGRAARRGGRVRG